MLMNRRQLIRGAAALLAAPAIVKFANIMPVKDRLERIEYTFSVWLKPDDGVGGWYRHSHNFMAHKDEHIRLYIPTKQLVCQAQLECMRPGFPLTVELRDTDGNAPRWATLL